MANDRTDAGWDDATLAAQLQATGARVWARLGDDDARHAAARPPALVLPPGFRSMLQRALALEDAERAPGWEQRSETLRTYYLTVMPEMRVTQLATASDPEARLFHSALDWSQMPRLTAGLTRFFALVERAGVAPERVFGAPDVAAFCARHPTLAHVYDRTYFGGLMPVLYGSPADMWALAEELATAPSVAAVIDRRLASPLIHELSHFQRDREALSPPSLDECVSGYLGVLARPALMHPDDGEDNGIFGAPWFAQVGQAVVHLFGQDAVVRAHAGVASWEDTLGSALVAALDRLGWAAYQRDRAVHFLGDTTRPEPWLKALYLGAAKRSLDGYTLDDLGALPWSDVPATVTAGDARALADALRTMCLAPSLVGGAWRVAMTTAPSDVRVDAARCVVERDALPCEDVAPRYLLPPAIGASLRARSLAQQVIRGLTPATVADHVSALITAA